MSETKYSKGLISNVDDLAERDKKQIEFLKNRQALTSAPAKGTGQLAQDLVGKVGVDRINTVGAVQPISNADDAMERIAKIRAANASEKAAALGVSYPPAEKVYDAGEMKRQFLEKNNPSPDKPKNKLLKFPGAKKVAGIVPVLGGALAAYSALDSGDAMAAVPFLNESESVGMPRMDERQMLAEHDARVNYDNSPAGMSARQARLEALKKLGQ